MSISKLLYRFVQKYLPLSLGLLTGVAAFSMLPVDWLSLSSSTEDVVYSIILGLVSSTTDSCKLNPYFVTGFIDGEGCFTVSIIKRPERKLGWQVIITFQIGLSPKDKDLLNQIQGYFGTGKIYKEGEKTC
jgi:hypothetical protein